MLDLNTPPSPSVSSSAPIDDATVPAQVLLAAQRHALAMVVTGAPLTDVLECLTNVVEAHTGAGVVAAILLLDAQGRMYTGAAPSLPEEYNRAIDGLVPRSDLGTCSVAAVTARVVVTRDIDADPMWQTLKHLPLALGLRAAWSQPIISGDGRVLGTFGTYFREPREPTPLERRLVETLAQTAALAIEGKAREAALRDSEAQFRDLTAVLERSVAERTRRLALSEARLRSIFETSYQYQGLLDVDGTLLEANATSLAGIGTALDDVIGRPFWETPWLTGTPGAADMVRDAVAQVAQGQTFREEIQVNLPEGGWRWFDFTMRPLRDSGGNVIAIIPEGVDITERRRAEEALRQSQKLEAIGQLTGGVAHDFNNLLTVIRTSADLLRRPSLNEQQRQRYLNAIADTADRGARLTAQLLAFARRQVLTPEVFDAGDRLQKIADMLRTIAGSRVTVQLMVDPEPLNVVADVSQFETALVNLVANARDAMNDEGGLCIQVSRTCKRPGDAGPVPGEHVCIAVQDEGCGIPQDRLGRIFEPFFTTKEVGRGTGLGLSQVYGFVQQSGGEVTVDSTPGVGTTFRLYLPACVQPGDALDGSGDLPDVLPTERRRILVVEDNAEVGSFCTQVLRDLGCETTLAANADEALHLLDVDASRFDLVLTDVVMPGKDGVQLAEAIRCRLPHLPIVLTSGYSHVLSQGRRHGFELLQKPYSVESLSRILRMHHKQPLPAE